MRMRDVYLSGIGVCLPEIKTIDWAVERGLVPEEHHQARGFGGAAVAGDMPAVDMALRAARDALASSGFGKHDLAALLYADVWYQGPEGWKPHYYLQHHLVGDHVLSVEIRNGCNGIFTGMELAVGCLRADPGHTAAMVATGDNFGTPLMNRWAPGTGDVVLGDAGSAVVLSQQRGFAQLLSTSTTALSDMEEACRAGEPFFPPGITVGRALNLMDRFEVFKKTAPPSVVWTMPLRHQQRSMECVQGALADADLRVDDIARVIVHNIGEDEVAAYVGALGFSLEQSTWSYGRNVGHTGSSDHMLSLHHLLATGQLRPGDHVLLAGFAIGATYESAVLRIVDTPSLAGSA